MSNYCYKDNIGWSCFRPKGHDGECTPSGVDPELLPPDPLGDFFESQGIKVVTATPSLDNELREKIYDILNDNLDPRIDEGQAYNNGLEEVYEEIASLIKKAREEAGLIERRQEVYQLWVWACDAHHKGLVSRAHGGYIRMLYRRFNDLTDQLQEQTGSTKYVHYGIDEDTLKPVDITELKKAVGKDNL